MFKTMDVKIQIKQLISKIINKPAVVLTPEEIKDKLEKHIEDIDSKMDVRLKLTKRMLIREMDAKLMNSLSKAVKMKREKSPTTFNNKIRRNKGSANKLPPLNPPNWMLKTSQNMRPKNSIAKERPAGNGLVHQAHSLRSDLLKLIWNS